MTVKLVRDKIPEIAPHRKFRQPEKWELSQLVMAKLLEEAQEVVDAKTREEAAEELADLYQVMLKYCEVIGYSWDEVLEAAEAKNAAKGKFDANWVLDEED